MAGWNLIALPYARRRDVTGALRGHLGSASQSARQKIEAERLQGSDFLKMRLHASEQAPRVFACYERPLPRPEDPATFIVSDGRWDLGLAAAASRATGGFSIAVESWPLLRRSGLAVFYAGVPVHYRFDDSTRRRPATNLKPADDIAEEFHSLLKQAMSLEGMLLHPMIRPALSTPIDITRIGDRPSFDPLRLPQTNPLHCAFYALVDERQMEQAFENTRGLVWRVSRTSLDVPYGVVVGMEPSQWEQWLGVQQRARTQALGMSLNGPKGSRWWSAGPDRLPLMGLARNIHDLLERASGFAEILDTNPADLRVPVPAVQS